MALDSEDTRSRTVGGLIGGAFGGGWALAAAAALPAPFDTIVGALTAVVLVALLWRSVLLLRGAPGKAGGGATSLRNPLFLAAVAGEGLVIVVGGRALVAAGLGFYALPLAAAAVGLHFFALAPAFHRPMYLRTGGAMVALAALVVVALPQRLTVAGESLELWQIALGAGCALILWASAARSLWAGQITRRSRGGASVERGDVAPRV